MISALGIAMPGVDRHTSKWCVVVGHIGDSEGEFEWDSVNRRIGTDT